AGAGATRFPCRAIIRGLGERPWSAPRSRACLAPLFPSETLMAHDVFISYSSHDQAAAESVCAALEQDQVRCWMAPRNVLPGVDYAVCLIEAINESRLLVLVFSSHANESPQVLREVERAVSKNIPIVPLRIDRVALSKHMEYFISSAHWLNAH